MSGTERIMERIMEGARVQADSNINQAEAEASAIIQGARIESEAEKDAILEKARAEAVERQKRILSVVELEARKRKLQAKQDMVNAAFVKALDRINNMPTEQYKQVLADLAAGLVDEGDYEVVLPEKDKISFGVDLIGRINVRLSKKSIRGTVKLSEANAGIQSGFILRKGNVEINYSFEAMIRAQREQLEAEVVKTLFM
jgi:V/A-type H+-transporting ATPase subunit E